MATTRTNTSEAIYRLDTATGAVAIAASVAAIKATEVIQITLNLNLAPTTSESLTVTINSVSGAAYDTLIYSLDLSTASTTDLLWQPSEDLWLMPGDSLDIAYTNTDKRTYGLSVVTKEVY